MMEEGFDFSQIKWIVIFAVFVIYKFFSAKPKVEPMTEEQEAEMLKEMERAFGQEEEESEPRIRVPQATPTKRADRKSAQSSKVEPTPLIEKKEEDGSEIAEEFDLQKAVIMSEILNRKYDE